MHAYYVGSPDSAVVGVYLHVGDGAQVLTTAHAYCAGSPDCAVVGVDLHFGDGAQVPYSLTYCTCEG